MGMYVNAKKSNFGAHHEMEYLRVTSTKATILPVLHTGIPVLLFIQCRRERANLNVKFESY
jgi:hypothetical protein